MNIILCGLPACGKTKYGKAIAKKMGWKFIDTDRLIEQNYLATTKHTNSCRQIFIQEGEKKFRLLEKQAIKSLKDTANCVIALGGGALFYPEIIKLLKSIGLIVYLNVKKEILLSSLLKRGIPAYLDIQDPIGSFEKLSQKRKHIYINTADIYVDTSSLSDEGIVEHIIKIQKERNHEQ